MPKVGAFPSLSMSFLLPSISSPCLCVSVVQNPVYQTKRGPPKGASKRSNSVYTDWKAYFWDIM